MSDLSSPLDALPSVFSARRRPRSIRAAPLSSFGPVGTLRLPSVAAGRGAHRRGLHRTRET